MLGKIIVPMFFAMLATSAAVAQTPTTNLKLSSGAPGGTFFEYGTGVARLVESKTNLKIAVSSSEGSLENIRRIEDGSADLALVAMGPAFEAWTASAAPWSGNAPLKRARALVPMYETPFHLATVAATGLKKAQDLDGKKVGVGPKGGSNELIFAAMADGLKIKPILIYGDLNELAAKVLSGDIDALFFGAGAPVPAYRKIAEAAPIVFIPLDGEPGMVLRKAFPYLSVGSIAAGTYKGQREPVATVALWNFLVAREGLPADQAYTFVRALLSNPAETSAVHPAAVGTIPSNVSANTFMPFHPGAIRFYDEIKIEIPASLK